MSHTPSSPDFVALSSASGSMDLASLYRLHIEETRDYAIFLISPEGVLRTWNPGVGALLGYSAEQFIGQPSSMTFTPEDRSQHEDKKEIETARNTGHAADVRWHLRQDGTRIFIDGVLTALHNHEGTLIGFSKIMKDATQRHLADQERNELLQREQAARAEAEMLHQRSRESEKLFRDAFAYAATGVSLTDPEGRYLQVNRAYCNLLGYTEQELLEISHYDVISPGDLPPSLSLVRQLLSGEIPGFILEKQFVRKDRTLVWVKNSVSLRRDDAGNPLNIVGITEDITERKKAEEALLSLSLLSSRIGSLTAGSFEMLDTLNQCAELLVTGLGAAFARIWLLDKDNVLQLYVSKGQYTHLDGPHSHIPVGHLKVGRIAEERRPYLSNSVVGDPNISDQDWARRENMVAFAGYPLVVGANLEGVLALFSRNPFTEASHLALSSISNGIAATIERKRNEQNLRQLEARSRQILESISDAFFAVDQNWQFTYINHRAEELLARHQNNLIGKGLWEEFPEAIGTPFEHHYREALASGKPTTFEAYFAPLDLWAEVHAYPSEIGLSVYFRDVRERRQMDEKLRETAKLESLGVMAGGIAHDFNNLLTGILGNASLLTELPDPLDRELAQDIVKASERAADLTRQMLAYSGKGKFLIQEIDLSSQVRDILRLIKPMVDRRAEIQLALAEKLPCVEADQGQIQQLVMNLVINAAESLQGKPGSVTITTNAVNLDNEAASRLLGAQDLLPGLYACLQVEDTGCGMDEATRAKIFDPFFTTKFTGRGLGLAAVSGIVRGHKGAIRVNSTLGKGTTFRVWLPAVKQSSVRAPEQQHKKWSGKGTILIIDDEEIVRRVDRVSLEGMGYEVILATDGQNGLDLFQKNIHRVSLVVLDMVMPVMGGEETLNELRKLRPEIPVILSSGYHEAEVVRRFSGQHISGFLQKPYTANALTESIREILNNPPKPQ